MGVASCGEDPFGNFDWTDVSAPDTVIIYSLARLEPNLPSGFSFAPPALGRGLIFIEEPDATGTWDMALGTQGPSLVFLPPGALGITAKAGIATMGPVSFEDLARAPGDTLLFELDDPVQMSAGNVYVVRTNRRNAGFGQTCVYYAKMEPLAIDVVGGTMEFRYVANPVCNSLDLIPAD